MKLILQIGKVILVLLLTLTVAIGQDPIEGFRDMKWGTSIDKAKEMMDLNEQEVNGPVTIYASPTDSHALGSLTLKEIYYFFHDEAGFYKVVLSGNGNENEEMDAILKNRLGRDYENIVNPSHTHKIWKVGDVMADYKEQLSKDFSFTIRSEAIADYEASRNKKITDF